MHTATTKLPPTVANTAGRITPKAAGLAWLALQLEGVRTLAASAGRSRLEREQLAKDIARGRTTNAALLGESIADAASHGADPVAVGAMAEQVASWFRSLVHTARLSLVECWERETREQVEADLAQRRAMLSSDPSVVLHAITETDEHLASLQLLRDALAARHTALTARCA